MLALIRTLRPTAERVESNVTLLLTFVVAAVSVLSIIGQREAFSNGATTDLCERLVAFWGHESRSSNCSRRRLCRVTYCRRYCTHSAPSSRIQNTIWKHTYQVTALFESFNTPTRTKATASGNVSCTAKVQTCIPIQEKDNTNLPITTAPFMIPATWPTVTSIISAIDCEAILKVWEPKRRMTD